MPCGTGRRGGSIGSILFVSFALAAIGTAILYRERARRNRQRQDPFEDHPRLVRLRLRCQFGLAHRSGPSLAIGTQVGPPFFRSTSGYGAAFKTYLRELIGGDVRPYLGHNPMRACVGLDIPRPPYLAGRDWSRSRRNGYLLPTIRSLDCQLDCGARGRSFDNCAIRQDWHRSHIVGGDALVPLAIFDHPLLELLRPSSSRS